jgi:acetyltransferase-like isoleucine patch superfamily enzyme
VLVTVVAVVLTLMTKPVYQASARLLVENSSISYNAIDTSNDTAFGLIDGSLTIEDGAWVGARATILPGAHIASHAVIAGGAVLSKPTEPYTVYAGNPAVPIRKRVIK